MQKLNVVFDNRDTTQREARTNGELVYAAGLYERMATVSKQRRGRIADANEAPIFTTTERGWRI